MPDRSPHRPDAHEPPTADQPMQPGPVRDAAPDPHPRFGRGAEDGVQDGADDGGGWFDREPVRDEARWTVSEPPGGDVVRFHDDLDDDLVLTRDVGGADEDPLTEDADEPPEVG